MANMSKIERGAVFAEEDFVVEVQLFLHNLMEEKGISRADLARSMGVTRARITQIFSDECKNFTVRLLARAVHALGETPAIQYKSVSNPKMMLMSSEDIETVWGIRGSFDEIKSQIPCNDRFPERLTGYNYLDMEWEAA